MFVFFHLCINPVYRRALPVWIFIANESQDISCNRLETHPYFCIVEVHTRHVHQSSQAKQCQMKQFRNIIKILLVCLYAMDLHWASKTNLIVTTQYLQNITYICLTIFDLVISQLVISYALNPSEIRTSRSKDVYSQPFRGFKGSHLGILLTWTIIPGKAKSILQRLHWKSQFIHNKLLFSISIYYDAGFYCY